MSHFAYIWTAALRNSCMREIRIVDLNVFLILLWSDVVENSCKNEWTYEVFLKTEIVVIIFSLDEVWRQPYFTSITLGLDRKILTLNAKINIDCTGWWFPLLNQNIYALTLRMTGGSNWFGRILEIKRLKSENKNINNLHNRCPKCIFAFFWQQSWQKKINNNFDLFLQSWQAIFDKI